MVHNAADGVFHKQSRVLLYMVGLNGKPGICGMVAVILMDDQM